MSEETAHEQDLAPERVAELIGSGAAEVVDVRQHYEWEAGRIPGSRHLPLDRLPLEAESLATDKPLVFVCRAGDRSAMATAAFREAGRDAFNLAGGLEAWAGRDLPLDPSGGDVLGGRPPTA